MRRKSCSQHHPRSQAAGHSVPGSEAVPTTEFGSLLPALPCNTGSPNSEPACVGFDDGKHAPVLPNFVHVEEIADRVCRPDPSARANWKGQVEKLFRALHDQASQDLPGFDES